MVAGLVQHLVLVCGLAAAVAIACRTMRLGPAGRHALWLVVLVKLTMPPVLTVRTPWAWSDVPVIGELRWTPPIRPSLSQASASEPASLAGSTLRAEPPRPGAATTPPAITAAASAATTAARPWPAAPARVFPTLRLAVALWISGAIIFLAVQAVRIRRLRRLLRRSHAAGPGLTVRAGTLARRHNLAAVPIRVVPGLASPLIWSLRRPMLLWPAELAPDLSDACLDGLIVHELAHVKRRDHWVSWIELAAGIAWWWNPLYWYVRAQVREHAELACDAWVVHTLPHGRRAYAEALVAVCDIASRRAVPVPAIGVSTGSRRVLERRLVMIMRGHVRARLSRIGAATIALLIAATLPVWAQRPPTTPPAQAPKAVVPPITTTPVEIAPDFSRPITTTRHVTPAATTAPLPVAQVVQALPTDAQRVIDRLENDQAQTRRDAEAKLQQQRATAVQQLQALFDSYTKAGRQDDAAAVRSQLRALQSERRPDFSATPAQARALPTTPPVNRTRGGGDTVPAGAPVSLMAYRNRVGETVPITVTGSRDGSIWGTDVYTDDSSVGAAAVHAGALQVGETASVLVMILPGRDSYGGSRQNGVSSQDYAEWGGSYRIVGVSDVRSGRISTTPSAPSVATTSGLPLSLSEFREHVFESFTASVVGSNDGAIWGSDIYTDDSPVAVAAVHAGLLKPGERGMLKITLLPGLSRYTAAERNGVSSSEYGRWEGSYRIERVK